MDIRRLHEAQLDTLKDIASVCEEHGIRYAIYCGTMLGAVRHQGFIPWDDDIDVVIPLPDYYTFQEIFTREMSDKYLTETYHSVPKSNILWTKINRRHTTYVSEKMFGHEMDWGISVDIYPMIGAADSAFGLALQKFLIQTAKVLVWTEFEKHAGTKYHGWHKIGYLTYVMPRKMRHWIADRILSAVMIDPKKKKRISTIDGAHFDAKYTHEMWQNLVQGEFEGELFPMPAEYDAILKIMYGDYMTLPPEEERMVHFRDQIVFSLHKDSNEIRIERKTEPMIKTSVIIPVYNTIEYLAECIDSVLAQTQKEIEIILVDDGSDDGSLEMCQEYADKYPFITLLRQAHEYQGTARNRGLRIAKGRYIYFMDSDDAIKPELFEKCYEACEERHLDFVIFDAHGFVYDENDKELVIPEDIWDRTTLGIEDRNYSGAEYWHTFYNDHGLLYVCWLHYIRKDYLLENDLFYEEKTYFEDNDWILRMYIHAQNLYYIPEELHLHRWRRGSNMLGGFTPGLLHGCIRMHDILLDIYEEYPQKEYRRMSRDVINLNINRFLRLQEIQPVSAYTDLLDRFIPHLKAQIYNPNLEEALYSFCERTCINICEGTKNWPGKPYEELKEFLKKSYARRIFLGNPENRVVIYGTGIVSKRFLDRYIQNYGQPEAELVFMNTVVTEESFEGYPVISVDQLKDHNPDVVIIASTKYKDEMIQTVQQILGQNVRYICVS